MKQTKEYEMDDVEERWNAGRITTGTNDSVVELGERTKAWVIYDGGINMTEVHMLCVLPERLKLDWGLSAIDMCCSIYVDDNCELDISVGGYDYSEASGQIIWFDMPAAERIGEYAEFNNVLYIMHSLHTLGRYNGGY
jgi:hypothetical protein